MEVLESRYVLSAGIGIYVPNTDKFTLRNEASAGVPTAGEFQFTAPGVKPVVGDWNGDGKDDFGVFDTNTATWSLRYGAESGAANAGVFPFGTPGGIPVVGDWNGDGRDDIGTYHAGTWQLRFGASPGIADAGTFTFGTSSDQPVVGDWNGDGKDGIGLYNAATSRWTLRQTATADSASAGSFVFGPSGLAVTGDWNGDGIDGIGVFQPSNARWTLRQTPSGGSADAGAFMFGTRQTLPVTGDWDGPATPVGSVATIALPPIDLDLLGLEIRTSPINVYVSSSQGDGKLLGNLLNVVSTLVDLKEASSAVNQILDSTIGLLNDANLNILNVGAGPLDEAQPGAMQVLELFVAPVHLDLLGVQVDTSPVRVTITSKSGEGLILGNVVTELIHLFDPPLPETLSVTFLNQKLDELLAKLNEHLPGIAPAPVPPVPISDGQILNLTVPALDLDLLGLLVQTSPITVNASAEAGDGKLLGNVLTTALKTLDATPEEMSELNTHINAVLAKVIGVLNAADLSLAGGAVDALPPLLQTLVSPTLTAPADGATAPILDLLIASPDETTPPVNVDLLGLVVTTSNIEAHLLAQTGEGNVLGNLLYNLANLADPGGSAALLNLINLLGAGSLNDPGDAEDGSVTPALPAPEELLTITVKPLNLNLLGLHVQTEPIVVTLATQAGDGKLLGNLLSGITTLINVEGVSNALENVLSTTVDLLNAATLEVSGVGSGVFDSGPVAVTPVLDLFVAPVHLDLLGLVATTEPIHLTITSQSGEGLVLGNVVSALANLFNPPLPDRLDIDTVNSKLEQLITQLNQQIPGIPPAPTPPVQLEPEQFLELTVPALDLNLLGLLLQSSPITVNAFAETGSGLLLGNVLTTVLNTVDATTENLTGLSENLNTILAKLIGVLNATDVILPTSLLDALPGILQTLTSPTLVTPTIGATTQVLDLNISSTTESGPPVDVNLLGLQVTTSNIDAQLLATTGEGQILGNLLYNVANLLNPGSSSTLLTLLSQLGRLSLAVSETATYQENAIATTLASDAVLTQNGSASFDQGTLTVMIVNASADDRLQIQHQGTGRGQIAVVGNDVRYEGVTIGTFRGGIGVQPLVVTFNEQATLTSIRALIRNVTYQTLSDNPNTESRQIVFRLVDGQGGTSNPASNIVDILPLNDAPILDASANPRLAAVRENDSNPAGTRVIDLIGNTIQDIDSGTTLGIAVFGASSNDGQWQYSLDGTTWQSMGVVSASSALLLPADTHAKVRFVPNAHFEGEVMLAYRAWDQSQGVPGGRLTTAGTTGGTGALSAAYDMALLEVLGENDAPQLTLGGTVNYKSKARPIVLASAASVSDLDSHNFDGGRLRVRIAAGASTSNRLLIGGDFTVDSRNNVRYGGVIIGRRVANGVGKNELVITFNANATPAIAQELVQSILFKSKGRGTRSVLFSISDGDGGTSPDRSVTVNVS